jgi:hypothetical protein
VIGFRISSQEDLKMSNNTINIISSTSRKEVAERRAAREEEITRLGRAITVARGNQKKVLCSEFLAFLGFIHNTPYARREWENQ